MKTVTIEQRTYTTYVQFIRIVKGCRACFCDGKDRILMTVSRGMISRLKKCRYDDLLYIKVTETCGLSPKGEFISHAHTHLKRKAVVDEIIRIAPWKEFAAEMQVDKEPPPPLPNTESIVKKGI